MSVPEEPAPRPRIGDTVHYVSHGTPVREDGTQAYASVCRAAIVTELTGDPDHPHQVGLAVLNPTGQFFDRAVPHHQGQETARPADCAEAEFHGNPFRYCACGWMEPALRGGTWHHRETCDA